MNYRIEQINGFSIVGIKERVNTKDAFQIIPGIWASAGEKGVFEKLWNIRQVGHKIRGILGVCSDGDFGRNEEFDYILAVSSEQTPPEGMVKIDFPQAAWAVFEAVGHPEGIQEIWKRLYTEWVPSAAYELANLPAIECYLPIEENKNELWVPIVKKQ